VATGGPALDRCTLMTTPRSAYCLLMTVPGRWSSKSISVLPPGRPARADAASPNKHPPMTTVRMRPIYHLP
jgi:hypothetical protein